MKYILNILAVILTSLALRAESVSYTCSATNTSESILTSPAVIRQITAVNAGSGTVTLKLFDTSSTNLTFSTGAYTNNVLSTVSAVTTYTDINGNEQNITNTVLRITPTLVGAATRDYRKVYTMVVPAGETMVYTPTTGIFLANGLAATNINLGITATIEYSKVR